MARRRKQTVGHRLRAYGLLILAVLALASLVGWGVGKIFISPGPETAAGSATASALAQQLAGSDGGIALPVDYQGALDSLAAKCTQGQAGIASLVDTQHDNLVQHGVTTLTRLSMLQYLDGEITTGLPKTDCGQLLSSYVTSKESG